MIFLSYMLPLGSWRSVFAVPSEVVDKHLRLAGAAQLKVLLFLLRHSDCLIECETLADSIGLSVEDTKDAVSYWVQCGLLCEDFGTLSPAGTAAPQSQYTKPTPSEPVKTEESPAAAKPAKKEKIRYSFAECAEIIANNEPIAQMLPVIEGILGKQLNHTEISMFVTVISWYGLSPDCLAMLVSYCKSIGKATVSYIEATARGWADDEILTLEKAEEKIAKLTKSRSAWNTIRTAFDIPERKPTATEEACSLRWLYEWGYGTDVIKIAYEKCINAKGKLNFSYINGILKSWYERGLINASQVIAAMEEQKNSAAKPDDSKKNTDSGRYSPTYDISEIESLLDDDWIDGN